MFCVKCGAQVTNPSAPFCTACGASLAASPGPAALAGAPAPPSAPPAVTGGAKSSTLWIKVVIALVAFAAVAFAAIVGTGIYVGYRMKKKVQEARAEYGLDKIGSLAPGGSAVAARDVCTLLSKDEVSQLTGVAITDAQGSTSECTYSSATNPRVVENKVTWESGAMAYKMATGAMNMVAGSEKPFVKIPGIGDEAMTIGLQGDVKEGFQNEAKKDKSGMISGMNRMFAQSPLFFRKGDVMVELTATEGRDLEETRKALAIKIASRL